MKLNNKGYMLVEIILASALAFGLVYFLFEITIKLKNKNDDLLVSTLMATDQAIITNMIMKDIYSDNGDGFLCNNLSVSNEKVIYNGETIFLNKYASLDSSLYTCNKIDNSVISINIPLSNPVTKEQFNVVIDYSINSN